jgi:phage-related holin
MIYGYAQVCADEKIPEENCTDFVPLKHMGGYNVIAFGLYSMTFANDLIEKAETDRVDSTMTYVLIGSYLGITTLVMVNIFIAVLVHTFNEVSEDSKAHFVLQRAIEVVNNENKLSVEKRHKYLSKLRMNYVDTSFSLNPLKVDSGADEESDPVKEAVKEIQEEIECLTDNLVYLEDQIVKKQISRETYNKYS